MSFFYCPGCKNDSVEFCDVDDDSKMCTECGYEVSNDELEKIEKFKNIMVGVITECNSLESGKKKGKGKKALSKLGIDVGNGEVITVVTNAKHVEEGKRVVVARIGATIGDIEVSKTSVGGVSSHGIICDSHMLGYKGGTKGLPVFLDDSFQPGSMPPLSRPT